MKIGQFCIATIGEKTASLSNSLYQIWKANPQPFTIDGVEYKSVKKHSTTVIAKAVKTRWYTFTDGAMMEVLEGESYKPRKEIEAVAYRSVRTWFEVE